MVAIDGKTLRGTIPLGQTHGVHLVAAYLPETGVTLAQLAVDQKTNEITVVLTLLAGRDLTRMVGTSNAMPYHQVLSLQIMDGGGDYRWFVKAHQPTLLADIQQVFAPSTSLLG